MKKVIVPKRPQETNESIDLDLVAGRPIFIVEKETKNVVGMLCSYTEQINKEGEPINYGKTYWIASTGFGGLVGRHNSLKECIWQLGNIKYEYITNLNIG